jgi:hypothetical protein
MARGFELAGGQSDGFDDGLLAHLATPRPGDLLPRHTISHLVEYLPDHDATPLESGLSATDSRVGNDVLAQALKLSRRAFEPVSWHGWKIA